MFYFTGAVILGVQTGPVAIFGDRKIPIDVCIIMETGNKFESRKRLLPYRHLQPLNSMVCNENLKKLLMLQSFLSLLNLFCFMASTAQNQYFHAANDGHKTECLLSKGCDCLGDIMHNSNSPSLITISNTVPK